MLETDSPQVEQLIDHAQQTGVLRPPFNTTTDQIVELLHAAKLGKLDQVNVINLKDCPRVNEEAFAAFVSAFEEGKLPRVRRLNFDKCAGVTEPHFGRFISALNQLSTESALESLRFDSCPGVTTEHFAEFVTAIRTGNLSNLKTLRFVECPGVTSEHFDSFAQAILDKKIPRLSALYFHRCSEIESEGFKKLVTAIEKGLVKSLKTIDFGDCPGVSEDGFGRLVQAINAKKIPYLSGVAFNRCPGVTSEHFDSFAQAILDKKIPRLSRVFFNDCSQIEPEGFEKLVTAIDNGITKKLTTINFGDCSGVNKDGFGRLVQGINAKKTPYLSIICFNRCPGVTSEHFDSFAQAILDNKIPRLSGVFFNGCSEIESEGFEKLVTAIENGITINLTTINFGDCSGVNKDGFGRLVQAIDARKVPFLSYVSFNSCPGVSSEHFDSFAQAILDKKIPRLSELCFHGCSKIESEGFKKLVTAIEKGLVKSLKTIDFGGCPGVSEDGFGRLVRAINANEIPSLSVICFNSCPGVTSKHFDSLAQAILDEKIPRLSGLYFNDCSQIKSGDFKNLVTAIENGIIKNLSTIHFGDCSGANEQIFGKFAKLWKKNKLPCLKKFYFYPDYRSSEQISVDKSILYEGDPEQIFSTHFDGEDLCVVKMVLLGKSNRGKTWFCRRVVQLVEPVGREKTLDFEVHRTEWLANVLNNLQQQTDPPELIAWDFAGEQHLHGLHHIFLEGTDVAVLVMADNQPAQTEVIPSIPYAETKGGNDLDYWEGFLRFNLPDRKVTVVVRTQCADSNAGELGNVDYGRFAKLDEEEKPFESDPLVIDKFDSKSPTRHTSVEDAQNVLMQAAQKAFNTRAESGSNELIKAIRTKMSDRGIAPLSDYFKWCEDADIARDKTSDALKRREFLKRLPILERMGELIYFGPREGVSSDTDSNMGNRGESKRTFRDRMQARARDKSKFGKLHEYVLNPAWLNKPLYDILHKAAQSETDNKELKYAGSLSRDKLIEILNPKIDKSLSGEDQDSQLQVLIQLLLLTELCHQGEIESEVRYFLPAMLKEDYSLIAYEDHIEVVLEWNFLDLSGVHRTIVQWFDRLMRTPSGKPRFWHQGMTADYLPEGAKARVKIELFAAPLTHTVTLRFSKDANPYSAMHAYEEILDNLKSNLGPCKSAPTNEEVVGRLVINQRKDGFYNIPATAESNIDANAEAEDTQPKHTIVVLATHWGPKLGGINTFNLDFCRELSQHSNNRVICVVQEAIDDLLRDKEKAESGVQLISIPDRETAPGSEPANDFAKNAEKTFEIRNISGPFVFVGHDVITGEKALALAESIESKSALIHHMSSESYAAHKRTGEAARHIEDMQREVIPKATHVLAVGPLLTLSARRIVGDESREVTQLVPGLPNIELVGNRGDRFVGVVAHGRFGKRDDIIKQGALAARSFGRLYKERRSLPSCPRMKLSVFGIDEGPEAQTQFRNIVSEEAGNIAVNSVAYPYTQDREGLLSTLAQQEIAVMPSLHEGFGLVGWEAIAAGVPLIVTEESGLHELLKETPPEYANCYYPVLIEGSYEDQPHEDDINRVFNEMVRIASDPQVAIDKAIKLRDYCKENYTWEKCIQDFLKAINLSETAVKN